MSDFLPEVFGHEDLKERLQRLIVTGRVPGGILLAGENGRFKTRIACAFARALLAGDDQGLVAEGASQAIKFDAGTHADFELVDSEENQRLLGIDRIRRLKDAFSLTPLEGDRRVAVVIGADRMTPEAGNALLKLLEEPPPGAHLVLTGQSTEAVMETLVSRCLVLTVPPQRKAQIQDLLLSRGLEPRRAALLSVLAEGRPGFALALAEDDLDTAVLFPGAGLLLEPGPPAERSDQALALIREGGHNPEQVRERFRWLLGALAFFLRRALKQRLGARSRDQDAAPMPLGEGLAALSPEDLESRLYRVLRALSDVNRNVSVDLLLRQMLLEWSARPATM